MLETALAHAARGFAVFPITPGQKTPPLISGWQHVATTDETQIRYWWLQWPTANVGIHCDGLLVLDVDAHKNGFESLAVLEEEIGLESTYEVESPRGGRHIYYRCATPVRNGVDVFGRGIDVRATAGYVLAAGSRTAAGEYRVVCDDPIAVADDRLVARSAPRSAPAVEHRDMVVDTDADAAIFRAQDFLRNYPEAIEGQGGDFQTYRAVCRVRDLGVPEERAAEALSEWNERCEPPWPPELLDVKIRNAYRYAQEPAGRLAPEALGFEAVADQQEINAADKPQISATLLHPADVVLGDILASEYLIKGVLERQSNAVLFGHWNVGKTFVVLDMAAAIATGQGWFGKRVRQGRVLYLGYEGIRAMKKRMLALRGKYPKLEDRDVPFEWQALGWPLTQAEGVRELGAALTAYADRHGGAPDLVIIDPLANALGGDDADANLMGALNQCVAALIQKQRCTVLRVHHSGHGNQDRARGHSSLPAGVDTEIRVDEQEIALTKQRDDVRSKVFFKLEVVKLGKDSDGDDVTTCVVEQIEDNPMSPELTRPQQELLDALLKLRGDGGMVSKVDVRNATQGLTAEQRRELIRVLERKQYLRVEGTGWVIAERGPMAIFD